MTVTLALRRLMQEDHQEHKSSLRDERGSKVSVCPSVCMLGSFSLCDAPEKLDFNATNSK